MKNPTTILFAIFLCGYAYFKYTAVPQLMGTPKYIATTCLLVVLTAIIPFIISWIAGSQKTGSAKLLILGTFPLLVSALGLAVYFYLFIAPNAPGMSVADVLPRAVMPGLVMSAILILPSLIKRVDSNSA